MPSSQRKFTRAEDELILRQSRGEIHLRELRVALRANVITLNRRAAELGVKILFSPRVPAPRGRLPGTAPSVQDDLTPARIRNDRLLKRLFEVHGDRSYEP